MIGSKVPPDGLIVGGLTVIPVKFPVTVRFPFIVTLAVEPLLESTPEKPVNPYPAPAVAVIATSAPASYEPPDGVSVPAPATRPSRPATRNGRPM